MNIFKTIQYREVTESLREITSRPLQGCTLSNKGNLYSPSNTLIKNRTTDSHPASHIYYHGKGITIWRLMCYVWLDDLSEYEASADEEKYINNYQITFRFWQKYHYLVDKVFKTSSDHIPLPTGVAFNLKTGKIVRMKPETRTLFNLEELALPTLVADYNALVANKNVTEHKTESVKINKVIELATQYKNLSARKDEVTKQIAELTAEQDSLIKAMSEIKINLTSSLK